MKITTIGLGIGVFVAVIAGAHPNAQACSPPRRLLSGRVTGLEVQVRVAGGGSVVCSVDRLKESTCQSFDLYFSKAAKQVTVGVNVDSASAASNLGGPGRWTLKDATGAVLEEKALSDLGPETFTIVDGSSTAAATTVCLRATERMATPEQADAGDGDAATDAGPAAEREVCAAINQSLTVTAQERDDYAATVAKECSGPDARGDGGATGADGGAGGADPGADSGGGCSAAGPQRGSQAPFAQLGMLGTALALAGVLRARRRR
jgi:hypothetical protein